jgi:hypothetical protein
MKTPHTERTTNLAAITSANLEELITALPSGSAIARDARSLADKLDREFELVQISIPVGD